MSDAKIPPAAEPAPPLPGAAPPPDEFAHIPGGGRRPPVLALAAAALAVFLGFRLRDEVGYALSSSTPQEIGDARALAERPLERLPLNRYVRLSGLPDRESAVVLDTRGSWAFSPLYRLRGAGGRFFVRRAPDPLPVALAERDVFVGRLMRFSDLSFAGSISRYFASSVNAAHFFRPAALQAALAGGPARVQVADLGGELVTLSPADKLSLDIARPGAIDIDIPRLRAVDVSAARRLVEAHGAQVLAERADGPDRFVVTATFAAERRDQSLSALGDLDPRVRVRPARATVEVLLQDLKAGPEGFSIAAQGTADPRTVALTDVLSARTHAPIKVPDDAVLLLEGERPRDQYKAIVVLGFLVAFTLVNLLALRRRT